MTDMPTARLAPQEVLSHRGGTMAHSRTQRVLPDFTLCNMQSAPDGQIVTFR